MRIHLSPRFPKQVCKTRLLVASSLSDLMNLDACPLYSLNAMEDLGTTSCKTYCII